VVRSQPPGRWLRPAAAAIGILDLKI
jgi:hypothetical protein